MSRTRRHFSAQQTDDVVRRHLAEKVPVSDLADELGIQPSLIHLWLRRVLEGAEIAKNRGLVEPLAKLADKIANSHSARKAPEAAGSSQRC